MQFNWYILFLTALIPLVVGAIWYSPLLFANAWMKTTGKTEEELKKGNMPLIFGLTYLFGIMLSMGMMVMVIHQMHIGSIFADDKAMADPNSAVSIYVKDFMTNYGHKFRTFKHGAFHGVLGGFFLALPIVAVIALFERRSFKYIAIHVGYWVLTMALIGGCICQWL